MTDGNMALLFPRPTDQEHERRRAVLLLRAAEVQRWGWDDYRYQWSTGEVFAVAAILGDREIISDLGESFETVYRRWAYDLWGMADAQKDEDDDLRATRNWFSERELEARRVLRDSEFEKSLRDVRGW
jgi:hypothetical protein